MRGTNNGRCDSAHQGTRRTAGRVNEKVVQTVEECAWEAAGRVQSASKGADLKKFELRPGQHLVASVDLSETA